MTETSPVAGLASPAGGCRARHRGRPGLGGRSPGRVTAGVRRCGSPTTAKGPASVGQRRGRRDRRGPRALGHGRLSPGSGAGQIPRRLAARTGDIGTIDDRGYFQIATDRAKDVIKSGGECDLFGGAGKPAHAGYPESVLEAAVIGIPDEKWTRTAAGHGRGDQKTRSTRSRAGELPRGARWPAGRFCRRTGRSSPRLPKHHVRSGSTTRRCSGPGSRMESWRSSG